MSVSVKYLLRVIIIGLALCWPAIISAQQDTMVTKSHEIELIDTSDYISSFYDSASDYNLIIAASRGYVSEIDRLIGRGADVNTETLEGITPLIFAVINGRLDAVIELLKYKAVVDKVTSDSETPLIIAVKNDNFEITETLIRAGADVDFPDRNGATPLLWASISGYLDIADLLLYYNASIDQKSDEGITPLLSSIMAGYEDVADLLIQTGANMEARNNMGNTPFLMAALNGDTLIMDLLYKQDVDIYAVNNESYNALDISIAADQSEAVRYLMKIGNKWTDMGSAAVDPYIVASKYRRKDIIAILREKSVPGGIKYGIDQAAFTLSSRVTPRDYYTGFSWSFKEPYLNAGILAGWDMKLWYTRVLIKDSEHLFYQYRDKGYLAYAGVFKDFVIHDNPFRSRFQFSTTLLAGYSFGHTLKGTLMAPADEFMVIPDISLKWNRKNLSASLGLEYIKSQFYNIGPVWVRAGVSYNLFFDKVRTQVTPIKWY